MFLPLGLYQPLFLILIFSWVLTWCMMCCYLSVNMKEQIRVARHAWRSNACEASLKSFISLMITHVQSVFCIACYRMSIYYKRSLSVIDWGSISWVSNKTRVMRFHFLFLLSFLKKKQVNFKGPSVSIYIIWHNWNRIFITMFSWVKKSPENKNHQESAMLNCMFLQ